MLDGLRLLVRELRHRVAFAYDSTSAAALLLVQYSGRRSAHAAAMLDHLLLNECLGVR